MATATDRLPSSAKIQTVQGRVLRKRLRMALVYMCLLIILALLFFPLFWMISTAFKTTDQAFAIPPLWIPTQPTFANFARLTQEAFGTYLLNSVIVSTATTLVTMVVSSMSAYSFTRLKNRTTQTLFWLILSTQMFPLAVLLIPIYLIIRDLRLLNTYWALILANLAFALPFAVWFLRSYFETIPIELEEAALIDGCTRLQALWAVIVPLAMPGVLASAFFTFLLAWDEYLMALTLTNRNSARTLPPGLIISYVGEFGYRWPEMMAASLVVVLPIIVVFAFFSRHLIRGLTEGAIK
jgi:multiple sugar transport system permease protein